MRIASTVIACVFVLASGLSLASGRPFKGANCDLKKPPATSGEDSAHGYAVKVYPRVRDIAADYNGCLTTWAPATKGYEVLGITYIDNGSAVAFWSPADKRRCEYKSGNSSDEKCPAYQTLMPKSMAPGCVKLMKQAGSQVTGCEYE